MQFDATYKGSSPAGSPFPHLKHPLSVKKLTFPKNKRLLKRGQFDKVRKAGLVFSTSSLFAAYRPSPSFRVGMTLSRKLGKACDRNLLRRRLKEIIRTTETIQLPFWIDLRPKKAALTKSFALLQTEMGAITEHLKEQIKPRQNLAPPCKSALSVKG